MNSFRNLGLGMAILFSAYIVAHLIVIFAGYSVKEIVLSKEGIVFRRGRSPIVMERISNVEVVSGGRVLKLTGSTWEGKTVKKRVTWSDVGRKRWQEFKHDLQELESTY